MVRTGGDQQFFTAKDEMTDIATAQTRHEDLLRAYDDWHRSIVPYRDETAAREARNKALKSVTADIFKAIAAAQPKPENDFQI